MESLDQVKDQVLRYAMTEKDVQTAKQSQDEIADRGDIDQFIVQMEDNLEGEELGMHYSYQKMSRDLQDYLNAFYSEGNMSGSGRLSRICQSDLQRRSVCFSGIMEKRSPRIIIGWQSRFFELKEGKLIYYKNEKPRGLINFDIVESESVVYSNSGAKARQILINGSLHLNRSLKNQRFDRIDEANFLKTADVGDIILFRGRRFGAKFTRQLTQSKFDHVAIILKFEAENKELFFLDSTSNVVKFRSNNPQIIGSKSHQMVKVQTIQGLNLQALEKFVKSVIGNKYHLPIRKVLFQRKSIDEGVKNRRFFCSELIAKAYKEVGLLNSDKGCHTYFPHNFSQKGKLELDKGATLGDEMLISFDEDEIKAERDRIIQENLKLQEYKNQMNQDKE
ncbi:UNKNOWN [Stylonychia lemnae]|uniref:Uncharacterized protein n=1 Tax=Stylonychia lemnae TaxID=5949 RepID=A0A078B070_STYLE|nr:UNKNOWN [Stylonychia lemnae]|eukprot:CDW86473.1 UNKNOWN [Stylonychia lemnae]